MPEDVGYLTPEEFAAKVKAKYPEYSEVPDVELTSRVLQKYPEYQEVVISGSPETRARIAEHRRALTPRDNRTALASLAMRRRYAPAELNMSPTTGEVMGEYAQLGSAVLAPEAMGMARGALARLPGMRGTGLRTVANPKVAGPISAGVQLARGKGPVDAGITGLEVAAMAAGGRAGAASLAERMAGGGRLGRLAKLLGLGRKVARGTAKAEKAAAAEVSAAERATLAARPPPMSSPPASQGMQNLAKPLPKPKPTIVGGSASSGGTTAVKPGNAAQALKLKPAGEWGKPERFDPKSVEEFVRKHVGTHSRRWIVDNLKEMGIRERGMASQIVDLIMQSI